MHKLQTIGIGGNLLDWFTSYLSERYQRVVLNGVHSDWCMINAGVPQGSILGPLLFLIFMNDIVDDLTCDPFLYADDTSILKSLNSYHDDTTVVNNDLQIISDWADQWRVTFNAQKTEYMIISKKPLRPPPIQLSLNGLLIKQVSNHCHLGLWLTDTLTWDRHTQELVKKSSKSVNLLKRMPRSIDRKTKIAIYKSYIRPILEYCTCVYNLYLSKFSGSL